MFFIAPHFKGLVLKFLRVDHHMQEVLRGTGIAFVLKGVGAGLSFLLNVMIARYLGAEGAGIYFMAFTLSTIAVAIGRMGLDNTILRFIATALANGDLAALKGLKRISSSMKQRSGSGDGRSWIGCDRSDPSMFN